MNNQTKLVRLYLLVLSMIVVLSGCLNTAQPPEVSVPITEQGGQLRVVVNVPTVFASTIAAQSFSYDYNLSTIEATVSMGDQEWTSSVSVTDSQAELVFANLPAGIWSIAVAVRDNEGSRVYAGTGQASIDNATMTQVSIALDLLLGTLDVQVAIPATLDVASATATLINPIGNNIQASLEIVEGIGYASFANVKATTWPIRIRLYDQDQKQIAWGEGPVFVLPDRLTTAQITLVDDQYDEGSLRVDIAWEIPPIAPTGLNAVKQNSTVLLTWHKNPESNVTGYMLYRSDKGSDQMWLVTASIVPYETFTDSDPQLEAGNSYLYWVFAYNDDGLVSPLSSPLEVAL